MVAFERLFHRKTTKLCGKSLFVEENVQVQFEERIITELQKTTQMTTVMERQITASGYTLKIRGFIHAVPLEPDGLENTRLNTCLTVSRI